MQAFAHLLDGLNTSIGRIVQEELGVTLDDRGLAKYHEVVRTYDDHFKVIARTRDLFPENFNFPINDLLPVFSELLGIPLTDINPHNLRNNRLAKPHGKADNSPLAGVCIRHNSDRIFKRRMVADLLYLNNA